MKYSEKMSLSVNEVMSQAIAAGHGYHDVTTCMIFFLKTTMGFNNKELSQIFGQKSEKSGARHHVLKYTRLMSVKDKKIINCMEFILDKMCDLPNQTIFADKQRIAYNVGLGSDTEWPEIS